MIGMKVTINDFKKLFFNDELARRLGMANARALKHSGAAIRRIARRRIKNARPMPLSQMSREDRNRFKAEQRAAREAGRPAPKRPMQASKPGESPRNRTGKLKNNILYGYDQASKSVVAGAAKLGGSDDAQQKLEHGGRIRKKKVRTRLRKIGDGGEIRIVEDPGKEGKSKRRKKRPSTVREVLPGVFVAYTRLRSQAQVVRANAINEQLFGEPDTSTTTELLARPYMEPSLRDAGPEIKKAFTNSIN
jgi:hypothetical protein